tara:strand:- start:12 stop:503 length:492 start_codon:yes stop_codon:yes gene_type:complete
MAGFTTKTFLKYDDYGTPKSAWNDIKNFIPSESKIWSPFYLDGKQKEIFSELGFDIYHEKKDFFEYEPEDYNIIVDNPPFDLKKEIFTRLKELDKPFIIICPSSMINTVYFRDLFRNSKIQILIPRRRIQFIKDGLETQNRCNFDCFYYCYKMNFDKDIIFLD